VLDLKEFNIHFYEGVKKVAVYYWGYNVALIQHDGIHRPTGVGCEDLSGIVNNQKAIRVLRDPCPHLAQDSTFDKFDAIKSAASSYTFASKFSDSGQVVLWSIHLKKDFALVAGSTYVKGYIGVDKIQTRTLFGINENGLWLCSSVYHLGVALDSDKAAPIIWKAGK